MSRSAWTLICCAALLAAGCSSSVPWDYNEPPTALDQTGLRSLEPESRVVVVGTFRNPTKASINWTDVGPGVTEAISQALRNDSKFDVWANERLAQDVEKILDGPTSRREDALGRLYEQHKHVRFVLIGKVTDFHHTGQVPKEIRRRQWFWGSKREAIAAIQFTMVDLRAQRVLVSDHVFGTYKTTRTKPDKLYADIAFGSYLFWNSPLGRATEAAIDNAMARIHEFVPTTVQPLVIVRQTGPRKLLLTGGSTREIKTGQEFFVCLYNEHEDRLVPVNDPQLDRPLRARIASTGGSTTAWLIGEKPLGLELRGAELRWDLPIGREKDIAKGIPPRDPADGSDNDEGVRAATAGDR